MEYTALMNDPSLQPLWQRGFGNEAGHLFQGIRDIPGTVTFFFVELTNIPKDRKITYSKIVCDYKPHRKEKERVRLTVGGERLDYSGYISSPRWWHSKHRNKAGPLVSWLKVNERDPSIFTKLSWQLALELNYFKVGITQKRH
jgi:hypothetical protein